MLVNIKFELHNYLVKICIIVHWVPVFCISHIILIVFVNQGNVVRVLRFINMNKHEFGVNMFCCCCFFMPHKCISGFGGHQHLPGSVRTSHFASLCAIRSSISLIHARVGGIRVRRHSSSFLFVILFHVHPAMYGCGYIVFFVCVGGPSAWRLEKCLSRLIIACFS